MLKKIYGATDSEGLRKAMRESIEDMELQEDITSTNTIVNAWDSEVKYAEAMGFIKCASIVGIGYLFAKVIK